jgi:hypothetical protein
MKALETVYEELRSEMLSCPEQERAPYRAILARLEATHRELAALSGYEWLYEPGAASGNHSPKRPTTKSPARYKKAS